MSCQDAPVRLFIALGMRALGDGHLPQIAFQSLAYCHLRTRRAGDMRACHHLLRFRSVAGNRPRLVLSERSWSEGANRCGAPSPSRNRQRF